MQKTAVSDKPIIGITTGELTNANRPDDPWVYGQTHFYTDAIEHAGGVPLLIPSTADAEIVDALYKLLDGVLLAGGNDVDPELYREAPHDKIEGVSKKRDITELRLMELAESDKKPVLAICRGAQLWNIAWGGSLHQHIPDVLESHIEHTVADKSTAKLHDAKVDPVSLLANILSLSEGRATIQVNSYHHQAINKLGRNLHVTAMASDSIIEAIESDAKDWFAVGVQWHPESMGETMWPLFDAFIDASKKKTIN